MSEVRFADFVLPLVYRRRLIVGLTGFVAIATVVAAVLWPQTWRAMVILLPPERRMDNPLFVPGGFEGLGASLRGITLRHVATPTDIFIAILQSRNVAEQLVEQFDLKTEYDVASTDKAIKRLGRDTDIATTRDGTILIATIASSAERAAELANAYVVELDRVNRSLALKEASGIREFIESELEESKGRLTEAEERLRAFQEKYGAVEITEQARAVITAAAALAAQILNAEVELGVLRRTRDETHPEVVAARDYLYELRLRLAEIEGERDPSIVSVEPQETSPGELSSDEPTRDIFPPLSKVPALGLEFGRLYRTVKTEETVVTLLTEQYHRARIEEKRSLPTVRVLDDAVPPERRYRPRRAFMVIVSTAVAFFVSVLVAYGLEIVVRIRRDPERYRDLHEIGHDLKRGLKS